MNPRFFIAAAALLAAALTLTLLEDAVLGGPLSRRRGGWLSAVIQHGPIVCGWAAVLCVVAGLRGVPRVRLPQMSVRALAAFATRGIPVADARAAAAFRVVFAAGLWYVLRAHHIERHDALQVVTFAALAFFAAGLYARVALIVATLAVWWWMLVWTREFGSHPVATLTAALPCLWPGRWSDAWSVDGMLGRRTPDAPSIRYGYAIWMPRLVIGVALLAAAVAKLLTPQWIANGTVKFAFVADYHRASVPWGLWIASHPAAAVAASAAAVAIEALAITAAFSRSWRYRLAIGLLVGALFTGFYLLQGEIWLGWWLLLIAFLPWEWTSRVERGAAATTNLSRAQWTAIVLLVAMQLTASTARLEIRPAVSAYDMYSTTFSSTAAFDRANPMLEYRFEAETAMGSWIDVTDCFERPASSEMADAWGRDIDTLRPYLSGCDSQVPAGIRRLRLFESLRVFDWQTGRFSWRYRDRPRWVVPI